MQYVYLIHLEEPLSPNHTTQHYVGWSRHLPQRLGYHKRGNGAALLRAANEKGIGWKVVRLWEGDHRDERHLKDQKETPVYCPVCANGKLKKAKWMNEIKDIENHV